VCKHSLYVDKFTRLFYLLIQLVRVANNGRWCRWWLQSDPCLTSETSNDQYRSLETREVKIRFPELHAQSTQLHFLLKLALATKLLCTAINLNSIKFNRLSFVIFTQNFTVVHLNDNRSDLQPTNKFLDFWPRVYYRDKNLHWLETRATSTIRSGRCSRCLELLTSESSVIGFNICFSLTFKDTVPEIFPWHHFDSSFSVTIRSGSRGLRAKFNYRHAKNYHWHWYWHWSYRPK